MSIVIFFFFFFFQILTGNSNSKTISNVVLPESINARVIRIYPLTWNSRICLRTEIYGCAAQGKKREYCHNLSIESSLSRTKVNRLLQLFRVRMCANNIDLQYERLVSKETSYGAVSVGK